MELLWAAVHWDFEDKKMNDSVKSDIVAQTWKLFHFFQDPFGNGITNASAEFLHKGDEQVLPYQSVNTTCAFKISTEVQKTYMKDAPQWTFLAHLIQMTDIQSNHSEAIDIFNCRCRYFEDFSLNHPDKFYFLPYTGPDVDD